MMNPPHKEEEESNVLLSKNKVVIKNRTVPSLIRELLDIETELPTYRDIVDLGMHIHDTLQKNKKTCCSGTSSRTRNNCLIVTSQLLEYAMRGNHIVVPTETLFPSDRLDVIFESKKKKKRKRKKPILSIEDRPLCMLLIHEDPGTGNVEFIHSELQFITSSLIKSRYFIRPYNEEVAKEEIWSSTSPILFPTTSSTTDWVGIEACSLWTKLETVIPRSNYDTGGGRESITDARASMLVKDMSETMDPISLLSVRDTVVLNAVRIPSLPKLRRIPDPGESSVIRTDTSHMKDCMLAHSIAFFDNSNEAMAHARKHGFYMGAHDISSESGAKAYFVTTSVFEAFRNIRMGECEAPPPDMYERGHDKKMIHSHECIRPESRTKLYLDIDIDLKDNAQLMRGLPFVPWSIIDNITFAAMFWFSHFFHKVFGTRVDNYSEDWAVLCATRPDKKISRHLILCKPECYFRTKIDLMMFMDMAKHALMNDIRARDRGDDFSIYKKGGGKVLNTDPTSWLTKVSTSIDHMTKRTIRSESCVVDFAVYSEFSCMRGLFCSKMNDPGRILDWVEMNPSGLEEDEDALPVRFRVCSSLPPSNPDDAMRDFHRWKCASIVCIEPANGRGLTLPLGLLASLPKTLYNDGENKRDVEVNKIRAFTDQCWRETSSVHEWDFVEDLIRSIILKRKMNGGRGGGAFGSWVYSSEEIAYGERKESCPYRMLRDYFSQENDPRISSFLDVTPWASCDRYHMTRRSDMRTDEEIEEARNAFYGNRTKRRKCYTSSTYDYGDKEGRKKRKNDHVRVCLRWSKWCPIAQRNHGAAGKVFLNIYRTGRVVCSCFHEDCKAKSKRVDGSVYWPLVPLTMEQNALLWGGEEQ